MHAPGCAAVPAEAREPEVLCVRLPWLDLLERGRTGRGGGRGGGRLSGRLRQEEAGAAPGAAGILPGFPVCEPVGRCRSAHRLSGGFEDLHRHAGAAVAGGEDRGPARCHALQISWQLEAADREWRRRLSCAGGPRQLHHDDAGGARPASLSNKTKVGIGDGIRGPTRLDRRRPRHRRLLLLPAWPPGGWGWAGAPDARASYPACSTGCARPMARTGAWWINETIAQPSHLSECVPDGPVEGCRSASSGRSRSAETEIIFLCHRPGRRTGRGPRDCASASSRTS